jgi:hypothetical protein
LPVVRELNGPYCNPTIAVGAFGVGEDERRSVFLVVIVVVVLAMAAPAFAGKGGQGRGKGGGGKPDRGTSTIAIVMVTDANSDGHANWGDQISFDVTTTATTQPNVNLTCSQNGAVVYGATTGYYDGYPWPWTQTMTLSSTNWSGGAANCSAVLRYYKGSKTINLASLSFTAGA